MSEPSAFWLRKIATYFERMDQDGDGRLTNNDVLILVDKLIENGRLNETRGNQLRSLLVEEWNTYFEGIADGKPLTKEAFLEIAKTMYHNDNVNELEKGMYPIIFSAIDTNADGVVDLEEYIAVYTFFGFDRDQAVVSFNAIDTDHDGVISLDEYVHAAMEFLNSEDETCGTKFFWGPLSEN